ncbi:YrrS family protein [Bacillus sp. EAC]|uniref:YrrS family protein n=1 Tax=Bacillus sp. EAC TaxID=1978338 RepID=UPI0015C4FE86|nr:YrrS family protein [Bacillus sp. EAC]
MNNFQGNSRATSRTRRKKAKLILSGSIVIVIVLIAIVSISILSSNDNKAASKKDAQASSKKKSVHSIKKDETAVKETSINIQIIEDSSSQDQTNVNTLDNSQSNSTIASETPEQTGVLHNTSYDSSSQDWQEMLQTISSATGIDQSYMTVWFLGSDKSNPGGSVGTVSAKAKGSQKYRVYLQWDGSRYIATKVEPAT